jgi:hypothetical protein
MSKINPSQNLSRQELLQAKADPAPAVGDKTRPDAAGEQEKIAGRGGLDKVAATGQKLASDTPGAAYAFTDDTMSEYRSGLDLLGQGDRPASLKNTMAARTGPAGATVAPAPTDDAGATPSTAPFDAGKTLRTLEDSFAAFSQNDMGGVYQAMHSMLQQAHSVKQDQMLEAKTAGAQKVNDARQSIEDKKSEIEKKTQAARDQFVTSVWLSVAQCVTTIAGATTAGMTGEAGLATTGPALARLRNDCAGHVQRYTSQTEGAAAQADQAGLKAMQQQHTKEMSETERAKSEQMMDAQKEHINRIMDMIKELQKIQKQSFDSTASI